MKKLVSCILVVLVVFSFSTPAFAAFSVAIDQKEYKLELTPIIQNTVKYSASKWVENDNLRAAIALCLVGDALASVPSLQNSFKLADVPSGGYIAKMTQYGQDGVGLFVWTKDKTLFLTYFPKPVTATYSVFNSLSRDEIKDCFKGSSYWEINKQAFDAAVFSLLPQ